MDEILDGIVDIVFSEIELPSAGGDWGSEMRRTAISARRVLRRHLWAIKLAIEHILKPGYDFGTEFEFVLTLILDALTRSKPDNREPPSYRPAG